MSAQQPFRLLDLPRELRDKIYEYTLPAEKDYPLEYTFDPDGALHPVQPVYKSAKFSIGASKKIDLLLASKQVNKEYKEAFERITKDGNSIDFRVKFPLRTQMDTHLQRRTMLDAVYDFHRQHPVNKVEHISAVFDMEVDGSMTDMIVDEDFGITRPVYDVTDCFVTNLLEYLTCPCDQVTIVFNFPDTPSCAELHRPELRKEMWPSWGMKDHFQDWLNDEGPYFWKTFIVQIKVGNKVYKSIFRSVHVDETNADVEDDRGEDDRDQDDSVGNDDGDESGEEKLKVTVEEREYIMA